MKKQSINLLLLGILGVAVLVIGIKVFSAPSSASEPINENGELTISETKWDFSDVAMSKGVATKKITLENKSALPIKIMNLETSCMCTNAQIVHENGSKSGIKGMVGHGGGISDLSETIKNGETATLLVNFDPNAHGPDATGPITRTVTMKTSSQKQPNIELTFSGNVIK